jgi:hypothetical protein
MFPQVWNCFRSGSGQRVGVYAALLLQIEYRYVGIIVRISVGIWFSHLGYVIPDLSVTQRIGRMENSCYIREGPPFHTRHDITTSSFYLS